jgi:hypothetical protein
VPVPLATTDNEDPEHNVSVPLKSVVKLGAVGSDNVTLNEDVPTHPFPLVSEKFAYVPADKFETVAVPELTDAENVPPV